MSMGVNLGVEVYYSLWRHRYHLAYREWLTGVFVDGLLTRLPHVINTTLAHYIKSLV